ncbi:MAG: hypothetical protein J5762_03930 [Clostridia bacterium]|nr:hypothetical protein [Clostridia bacterium]
MKKILTTVTAMALVAMLALSLAACSGLSGSYASSYCTYTFSGDKFTCVYTVGALSYTTEGTYKLGKDDSGNDTITFTKTSESKDGDKTEYNTALSFNKGSDNKGEYIEISGTKYYKK